MINQGFVYDLTFRTDIYYQVSAPPDRRSAIIGYGKRSLGINDDPQLAKQPHAYSVPSSI